MFGSYFLILIVSFICALVLKKRPWRVAFGIITFILIVCPIGLFICGPKYELLCYFLILIATFVCALVLKKRAWRVACGIITVLLIVCPFGHMCYKLDYEVLPVATSKSPNGAYELAFQQLGEPDFPRGDTKARFVLKNGRKTVLKKNFFIANDGAYAGTDNWGDIHWKDNSVEVTIYGKEQNDERIILNFDGTDESKTLGTNRWREKHYGKTPSEYNTEETVDSVGDGGYSHTEENNHTNIDEKGTTSTKQDE